MHLGSDVTCQPWYAGVFETINNPLFSCELHSPLLQPLGSPWLRLSSCFTGYAPGMKGA